MSWKLLPIVVRRGRIVSVGTGAVESARIPVMRRWLGMTMLPGTIVSFIMLPIRIRVIAISRRRSVRLLGHVHSSRRCPVRIGVRGRMWGIAIWFGLVLTRRRGRRIVIHSLQGRLVGCIGRNGWLLRMRPRRCDNMLFRNFSSDGIGRKGPPLHRSAGCRLRAVLLVGNNRLGFRSRGLLGLGPRVVISDLHADFASVLALVRQTMPKIALPSAGYDDISEVYPRLPNQISPFIVIED